jgi:hypothetical protein
MSATDFIENCLAENEIPTLFSCPYEFCSFDEDAVIESFIRLFQTRYKMNIVPWTPSNLAYPNYMLLGGDRGILAYIRFAYIESRSAFEAGLLSTPSMPVLQTITKAESHLDRPVFFISLINCQDKCEIRFETNEQIKDRWLNTGFSDPTYCPIYEEMGDANDLLNIWNDLKKNSVHFY